MNFNFGRTNKIIAAIIFLFVFGIYLETAPPTVPFWDAGEFIAASYTMGVPHPPGTPTYVLLGKFFTLILPWMDPQMVPFEVNFMSVLTASLAIMFLFLCVVRVARKWMGDPKTFGEAVPIFLSGVSAAILSAFADTYWTNATEAEVYAPHAFIIFFSLWLMLRWGEGEKPRNHKLLLLVAYLAWLGVGNHLGSVLLLPGFILYAATKELDDRRSEATLWQGIFLVSLIGLPIFYKHWFLSNNLTPVLVIVSMLIVAGYMVFLSRVIKPKADPMLLAFLALLAGPLLLILATLLPPGVPTAGRLAISGALIIVYTLVVERSLPKESKSISGAIIKWGGAVVLLAVVAVSIHLYLMYRSRLDPGIDEANPETFGGLMDVIQRKQYEPMKFMPRRSPFPHQLWLFWNYLKPQFTVAPLFLGFVGAYQHFKNHRHTFYLYAVNFFILSFGLILYINLNEPEIRPRHYFWTPSHLYWAMWMGIGAGEIVRWISREVKRVSYAVAGAFLLFSFIPFIYHHHTHDRGNNYIAYDYAHNLLAGLDRNAIIFTNGDNDTFPLWYIQEVEGFRTDVAVVNLSLLNTNWYVEQVKNKMKVPVSMSDEDIQALMPFWTRDPETNEPRLITLRNIAISDILRTNNWARPVYFAVTVSDYEGLDDYLSMEGLVFKLTRNKERNQINVELAEKNLYELYQYRSILTDDFQRDTSVYKDENASKLISNYSAGFARLGFHELTQGEGTRAEKAARAIEHFKIAMEISPEYKPALNGLIVSYAQLGDSQKALEYAEQYAGLSPNNPDAHLRLGGTYEMIARELQKELEASGALDDVETPGMNEQLRSVLLNAAASYEKALELSKDDMRMKRAALQGLVAVYTGLGDQNKSTEYYRMLTRMTGQSAQPGQPQIMVPGEGVSEQRKDELEQEMREKMESQQQGSEQ
jgi:tetratricopeptide (TPR) repeat protein